jgi:hypothetical protein
VQGGSKKVKPASSVQVVEAKAAAAAAAQAAAAVQAEAAAHAHRDGILLASNIDFADTMRLGSASLAIRALNILQQCANEPDDPGAAQRALGAGFSLGARAAEVLLLSPTLEAALEVAQRCGQLGIALTHGGQPWLTSPAMLGQLLRAKKYDWVHAHLAALGDGDGAPGGPEWLQGAGSPPLVDALLAGAPLDLVGALAGECARLRAPSGGVDEASPRGDTAVGLALQQAGRPHLPALIPHSGCGPTRVPTCPDPISPLHFAVSEGAADVALLVLKRLWEMNTDEHVPGEGWLSQRVSEAQGKVTPLARCARLQGGAAAGVRA